MRFIAAVLSFVVAAYAIPANLHTSRSINPLQDVVVFNAAAFQNPDNAEETLVGLQSFVFVRQIDFGFLADGLSSVLETLGLDIGDQIDQVLERAKLFGAIGLPGVEVEMTVDGCSNEITLPSTSGLPDLGMVLQNASLGACNAEPELLAEVKTSFLTSRTFNATIFSSPPDGFGVISDIDDTIKISNVLDKIELVKTTFLDDPTPVPGMPELYASLSQTLNSPQFIYISGSPFQLYPFLRDFVSTSFPESNGPILLKNLTLVDIGGVVDFIAGGEATFNYKVSMIDRIKGMYPNKRFMAIGDSTEEDPEIYAEAFKKYGDFIMCIWIHEVEGADNSDERFATSFAGIPAERVRTFSDAEIPGLQAIDLAGGQC